MTALATDPSEGEPTQLTHQTTPTDPEAGMATAEYAIGTVAAAGFAALLLVIINSGGVMEALTGIITRALSVG